MILAILALLAGSLFAQPLTAQTSIVDVMNAVNLLSAKTTPITTVTAGDGSTITLSKINGPTLRFTVSRSGLPSYTVTAGTAAAVEMPQSSTTGVLCLVLYNPTLASVTLGSLTAAAGGGAWQCGAWSGTTAGTGTQALTAGTWSTP